VNEIVCTVQLYCVLRLELKVGKNKRRRTVSKIVSILILVVIDLPVVGHVDRDIEEWQQTITITLRMQGLSMGKQIILYSLHRIIILMGFMGLSI